MAAEIETPIKVEIDAEAVNRQVAEAIVNSALGERVEKAVNDALGKGYFSGRDAIKDAIEHEVYEQARRIVREEFTEQIKEAVRAKATPELIEDAAQRFLTTSLLGGPEA